MTEFTSNYFFDESSSLYVIYMNNFPPFIQTNDDT